MTQSIKHEWCTISGPFSISFESLKVLSAKKIKMLKEKLSSWTNIPSVAHYSTLKTYRVPFFILLIQGISHPMTKSFQDIKNNLNYNSIITLQYHEWINRDYRLEMIIIY